MLFISILELESAINYWRFKSPSVGETLQLSPEVAALAKHYAMLIIQGAQREALDLLDEKAREAWYGYQDAMRQQNELTDTHKGA